MTMTTARSSCPASPTTASHSKREWTTSRLFSKKSSSTKSNRTKTAIKFMGSSATGMTASSPLTKYVSFHDLVASASLLQHAIRSISPKRMLSGSTSSTTLAGGTGLRVISKKSLCPSATVDYGVVHSGCRRMAIGDWGVRRGLATKLPWVPHSCSQPFWPLQQVLPLPTSAKTGRASLPHLWPSHYFRKLGWGAPPPKLLLEVPRASNSHSPSPISSISGQLKELRKRSLSEISLILEIIKGVTAGVDPSSRSGSRRFRTASPSTPRQSNGGSLNRVSLSTGDLGKREESMEEENRKYLRVPMEDGKSSPALSRISSFVGQKRSTATRIRWNRLSPHHIQRTMDIVQEEKAMQMAPNAPIDATKFVAYVQERRKKRILFKGEYLLILLDPQKCTTEVGIRMGDKNQYNDTLPYDYNRVILESRSGFEDSHGISDYINASYVQSWMKEKAYVVTQAVKTKQASNDFWRCVWEMRSNAIVMLTKVFDFMRVMCLQYWPQGKFQFGEIDVETLETKTYAHFVIRTFRLTRLAGGTPSELEETRIVKHFHFTEWELNSFPYISAFIELRRRVRQWTDKTPHPDSLTSGPVIVHCR
uniref:Tyrosine-protein phosphatase domain-containing protein n=2 Tax=Ditylenchus dipsaci TaxID=166011 RepID=A0A915DJ71_9BILA